MKNSWQTVERHIQYENDWIRVEHHDIINPAGKPGIYGTVHFKNYALGIIPLDLSDNTWLVGQYRYALDRYSWEIPMGGGPLSTDILKGAQRELKEETGLSAHQWECILELHTSNCVTDETGYVFVARDLEYGPPCFDETEDLKIKKIPFDEAVKLVLNGEITDAISVAGILRLDYLRRQQNPSDKSGS